MADHISSTGGILCCDNTYDADHAVGLFKISVNDPDEISCGTMTGQLQYDGKIGLTNAGDVSHVILNIYLSLKFDTC